MRAFYTRTRACVLHARTHPYRLARTRANLSRLIRRRAWQRVTRFAHFLQLALTHRLTRVSEDGKRGGARRTEKRKKKAEAGSRRRDV